eukprot:CAMPEP_0170568098 /NCGR_PEP_ID=MMETSP0211-20121228/80923_1 /TAXON_ID=311385 /ORGANISM="Pseudokeronopsis sp., Strain OXSARD2" /LENGTH=73 /DNA_ID=CAMNT_0010889781 /DNA_START=1307 /DNA_END=1528 /DNA_ORIENTATION=-
MLYSRKFLIKNAQDKKKKKLGDQQLKKHLIDMKNYHYRDWRNIIKFHENKHKILHGGEFSQINMNNGENGLSA